MQYFMEILHGNIMVCHMIYLIEDFTRPMKNVIDKSLGNGDSLINTLIAFVVIDYATGVLLAIYTKKLSSEIGFKGIIRKILIFVVVSMGNMIDQYLIQGWDSLRNLATLFYIANDGISIFENIALSGLPIPEKLKSILHQINNKEQ